MITGMRLDNFRGFVTTGDLEFSRINLFYGPNSGGKSTILRALSLLKQSFDHNDDNVSCPLLPYKHDGVDMGSPTSLHHNLDATVPFSLTLRSRTTHPMSISRPVQYSAQEAPDQFARAMGREWPPVEVFFSERSSDLSLRLTICDGGQQASLDLQEITVGNSHFSACLTAVDPATRRGDRVFETQLCDLLNLYTPDDDSKVLVADVEGQSARRKSILGNRFVRQRQRYRFHMGEDFDTSGCFEVSKVTLSDQYSSAVAAYLRASSSDISTYAREVARDCEKLSPTNRRHGADNTDPLSLDLRGGMERYFRDIAKFFSQKPDAATCLEWWRRDLKRCRILLYGYAGAVYEAGAIPPLAYWLQHDSWATWRQMTSDCERRYIENARHRFQDGIPIGSGDCDDVSGLYNRAAKAVSESLAALRDIGPDRVSAERVYRVEPRNKVQRNDHVGRRAAEVPRLLHASPQLLEEVNRWLRKVNIPYKLGVDALEIHGGGQVRQTGLFELTAELSHTRNARINLCDVGHGVFKQLGLPVQVFLGDGLIITIEEPETNVHPRLQAEIADLFIDAAVRRRHQIFAEAHSELLALRLQRRIAEGKISHEDVKIFYVHAPGSGPSEVLPLQLDSHGNLLNEPPGGFMDEWLREV